MKSTDLPKFMPVAFGVNGQRQDLQASSVSGTSLASYDSGFPPITMVDKTAGGIPPQGKDFNQILYELSADAKWNQASGVYPYNADFSTAIGGYPKGALVLGDDGLSIYQSQKDNNESLIDTEDWFKLPTDNQSYVSPYNFYVKLPYTTEIFTKTELISAFSSTGFYKKGDNGNGLWISTGNTDTSLSGTHLPKKALIYDASGHEYQLDITGGEIDARANGAVQFPASQQSTTLLTDSDNVVCLGDVLTGIASLVGDSYDYSGNNYQDTVDNSLLVNLRTGYYRQAKTPLPIKSHISYDFGKSCIIQQAAPSYKFSATGSRLDLLAHSVANIEAVYNVIQSESWSALSATNFKIRGGSFFGDQKPSVTESACSSGNGFFLLNCEYSDIEDCYISGFEWPIMARQLNSLTDGSGNYITPDSTVITGQIGNFYGINFKNVRCNSGRKGLAYIDIDWCTWQGGSLCDSADWANGVDGVAPDYFLQDRGSAFHCNGCNLTVQHSDLTNLRLQPAKSVVYTKAKGSTYVSNYLEWTESFMTVSAEGWNTQSQMGHGLNIDTIGGQYRPVSNWKYITFEEGCFGEFNSSGTWVDPTKYSKQGAFRGISFLRMGSPVRDLSAFRHGGLDFKYGTYGITYTGSVPDIDFLRGTKEAKEFINPYGLPLVNGTVRVPMENPSLRSNICIWVKDLTGNYDGTNMRVWLAGGEGSDTGMWAGRASETIDFGNGYKLFTIQNLRENVNDGVASNQQYITLQISATTSTPIYLKAIEAYEGGIPFFPGGCDYVPESDGEMMWDATSWNGTPTSTLLQYGGGVFQPGDIVNPSSRITAYQYDSYGIIQRSNAFLSNGNNSNRVITGGLSAGNAVNHSFSASITSVTSTTTVITVSSANAIFIMAGLQHYISATTGSGSTGNVFVGSRVYGSDGTATYQYVLDGVYGAVGDTLTMDLSKVSGYTSTSGNPSFDTRIDVGQAVRIGYGQTSSATREVQFYGSGSTVGARVQYDTSGNLNIYGQSTIAVQSPITINGYTVTNIGATAPTSANSSGVKGQIATDSTYVYICTATNTWIRMPITSW